MGVVCTHIGGKSVVCGVCSGPTHTPTHVSTHNMCAHNTLYHECAHNTLHIAHIHVTHRHKAYRHIAHIAHSTQTHSTKTYSTQHSSMSCPHHTFIYFKPFFLHNILPTCPSLFIHTLLNAPCHKRASNCHKKRARNNRCALKKLQHGRDTNRTYMQAKLYKMHMRKLHTFQTIRVSQKLVPYRS